MISRQGVIAGLAGLVIGGSAVALATGGVGTQRDSGKAEVEKIVRDYVLANPEIIPEAMERLRAREVGNVVEANRAAFETPFGNAWAGDEKGDVVVVEFFDYACGFCRQSNADIERLLAEDKNLKVVWRELPVLGPNSVTAAEASLAAAKQGKFHEYYERLFAAGRPTPAAVAAAREAAGVAAAPPPPEAMAEIQKNFELAQAVNTTGTPTFIVGDQVLQGAVGYKALKDAIAAARAKA